MNERIERISLKEPQMNDTSIKLARLVAAGWVAAVAPATSSAQPLDCLIQPNQVIQLGSAVAGVLDRVLVERGDIVKQGQVVAQLHSDVERATLALAQKRAEMEAELKGADKTADFAQREHQRASELYDKKFVSQGFVDKTATEASVAQSKVYQAKERRQVAAMELQVAQAQLSQRSIRSPIAGVVTDRYLSAGEYIDDKALLKIAKIDPLRIEVVVPAGAYGQVEVGAQAMVTPDLAGAKAGAAKVTIVDRVVDAASNTFRVRLELPNPDNQIPAGLRCKVDLGIRLPGKATASNAMAAPAATSAAIR